MITNEEKLKLLEKVELELKKVMDAYVGKVNVTPINLEDLRSEIMGCFTDFPCLDDQEHLQFTTGKKPDEVVPANLYTALRMYLGGDAPTWEHCKAGRWEMEDGTEFIWSDGETLMILPLPLNRINLSFESVRSDFIEPQSGELFVYKDKAAFVRYEHGKSIHWDLALPAFSELVGAKDPEDCFSVGLDANEWIAGVPYTWGFAGANGAYFRTYQLPGVPDSAVEACRDELKRNQDVVGRITNVKIYELIEFECPQEHIP